MPLSQHQQTLLLRFVVSIIQSVLKISLNFMFNWLIFLHTLHSFRSKFSSQPKKLCKTDFSTSNQHCFYQK